MFKEFKTVYPKRYRIHSKIALQRFKMWLAIKYPELTIGEVSTLTFEEYKKELDREGD